MDRKSKTTRNVPLPGWIVVHTYGGGVSRRNLSTIEMRASSIDKIHEVEGFHAKIGHEELCESREQVKTKIVAAERALARQHAKMLKPGKLLVSKSPKMPDFAAMTKRIKAIGKKLDRIKGRS